MYPFIVSFRRHEAADGRTHADDAGTTTHDASPSADDDASQAGHDATGQIRAGGFSQFSFKDVFFNTLCCAGVKIQISRLTLANCSAHTFKERV